LRIVYANSWMGNTCVELVVDDARQQPLITYAVFKKGDQFVNYNLGPDDLDGTCNMAGVDLTNVAEKELRDLTPRDVN